MTDDNIESIWRQTMRSSADNAPMAFARALVAAERERLALLAESRTDGWHSLTADEIRRGAL